MGPNLEADNAVDHDAERAHGRVGYGRFGRYTPLALAIIIILVLLIAGISNASDGSPSGVTLPDTPQVGQAAPDVSLTLFDDSELRFADLQGSVVVVNFWASWCKPCEAEAPEFQAVSQHPPDLDGTDVRFVGVALKSDREENARAFVDRFGLTFPNGRDADGDAPLFGAIQRAFGIVDGFYPATIFLAPDGTIAALHYGQLNAEQLRAYIVAAAESRAA